MAATKKPTKTPTHFVYEKDDDCLYPCFSEQEMLDKMESLLETERLTDITGFEASKVFKPRIAVVVMTDGKEVIAKTKQ